jgi:hypothetical protein
MKLNDALPRIVAIIPAFYEEKTFPTLLKG